MTWRRNRPLSAAFGCFTAASVFLGLVSPVMAMALRHQTRARAIIFAIASGQEFQHPPVRISGSIEAGNLISNPEPVYPPVAKMAKVEGAVVLHAIIGEDGTVRKLSVISGPNMLQSAAVDAVKQWTYKPYLLNGDPVAVETTVTVNFHLPS